LTFYAHRIAKAAANITANLKMHNLKPKKYALLLKINDNLLILLKMHFCTFAAHKLKITFLRVQKIKTPIFG